MKKNFIFYAMGLGILFAFNSCGDNEDEPQVQVEEPTLEFLNSSECLKDWEHNDNPDIAIEPRNMVPGFQYNSETAVLTIELNDFNSSCSTKPKQSLQLVGDTIKVLTYSDTKEDENCFCFYNLKSQVSNLKKGIYYVEFSSYGHIDDIIGFDLNYTTPEGYIERWIDVPREEQKTNDVTIINGKSECTQNTSSDTTLKSSTINDLPDSLDLGNVIVIKPFEETPIVFSYEKGLKELTLSTTKILAGCDGTLVHDISLSGDTIKLNIKGEGGKSSGDVSVNCICTYNLTSKVIGLEPKLYHITKCGYLQQEVIDLTREDEGVVYQ